MKDETPLLEPQAAYKLWAVTYPPYAHNPLMLAEERAMLALLSPDMSGRNVLDAGCGSGRYVLHAQRRGAAVIVGVDLTLEMLRSAQIALSIDHESAVVKADIGLVQAGLEAIPLRDGWADITLCGLTLGHLSQLTPPLAELRRVTRPGGLLLCSDFHPIGATLGWRRDFKAGGQRYVVRHTAHTLDAWRAACHEIGLYIESMIETHIDPADIPPGARFDPSALATPVALVLALRRK